MIFLGIETSCDETALALIQERRILAQCLYSQTQEHQAYGGVVPNIAAHAHIHHLPSMARQLLTPFGVEKIGGIAVTAGPGLVGGLLVGALFAKGLALSLGKPLWGIHHLEAHGLMARMTEEIPFPYLLLLLSGGHCQLVLMQALGHYRILGETLDDAVGECLDKVARCLGLGYPGGPIIERLALQGDPHSIALPVPLQKDIGYHFSFSGLKTACFQWIKAQPTPLSEGQKADFCASLQRVIADSLCARLAYALQHTPVATCVVSGGVAANRYFYHRLKEVAAGVRLVTPPVAYCTDNAVMVAWAGYERARQGISPYMHFAVQARWSLEECR